MPVLADLTIDGQPRKVVLFANRNGFFYIARPRDRQADHVAKPFVETTLGRRRSSPTAGPLAAAEHRSRPRTGTESVPT